MQDEERKKLMALSAKRAADTLVMLQRGRNMKDVKPTLKERIRALALKMMKKKGSGHNLIPQEYYNDK